MVFILTVSLTFWKEWKNLYAKPQVFQFFIILDNWCSIWNFRNYNLLFWVLSLPACWFMLSIALIFIYLHFSHFVCLLFNPFIWIIPVKLSHNSWYGIYYMKVIKGRIERMVFWFWSLFRILNDSPSVTDGSKCSKSYLLEMAVSVSCLHSWLSKVGCQVVNTVTVFQVLKNPCRNETIHCFSD